MAFDAFLKIEGITGESTNAKHKGEIEVLAYSWNIANKQSIASGGGAGAGKVSVQDFSIVKHIDIASPALFVAVCSGKRFEEALFTVEEAGGRKGAPMEFLKIKFTDLLISSFTTGGGGGEAPTDQVSLNFARIEIEVKDARGQSKEESCDFRTGESG